MSRMWGDSRVEAKAFCCTSIISTRGVAAGNGRGKPSDAMRTLQSGKKQRPVTFHKERNAMEDEAKWHWAEGMKYAIEAIKAQFILNGAAAVSTLTFIGNAKIQSASSSLCNDMFCDWRFNGSSYSLDAYFTQLHYGRRVSISNFRSCPSGQMGCRGEVALCRLFLCTRWVALCLWQAFCCAAVGLWPNGVSATPR